MFNFKKQKKLKQQRDRFLAYAFASADLFIEVDAEGVILYATGAVKSLTGIDHDSLPGKKWLTIFEPKHHALLMKLRKTAMPGLRQGPFLIELNQKFGGKRGILTTIKLPNSKNFYITLGVSSILLDALSKLMEEHEDGPMLTGFAAEDLTEEEPLTTDFVPEDESQPETDATEGTPGEEEPVTTDLPPEDKYVDDLLPEGFHDLQDDGMVVTDFIADDLMEDEAMTTGFVADDSHEDVLTTGFVADDLDNEAMTPDLKPEIENDQILTTDFSGEAGGVDDMLEERSDFHDEAKRVFKYAKRNNVGASMTVFDFGSTGTIPEENWSEILGRIAELMRNESLADCPPVHIKGNTYGLLHNSDRQMEKFKGHIEKMSKELDPAGNGIDVSLKTIDASLHEISSDEATRALLHTINAFKEDKDETIQMSLAQNMKKLVTTNRDKLSEFKAIIERVDFNINFQPIVAAKTGEAEHYEVLCRVNSGDIGDWVLFGEDNGLAPNFDLAVLERTMNYIHFKAGTTRTRFAINISSKSIEDKNFFEKFHEQLARRDLNTRLLIEINNPRTIEDFKTLESFVFSLTDLDYPVTLDNIVFEKDLPDFLEKLDVSYIKTNHKMLKRLYEEPDGKEILDEIISACKNRNIKIIGQFIEEEEQLEFLKQIGIPCAQGYLFGHAESAPKFIPPRS